MIKGDDQEDAQRVLATMRHVLKNLALVMAPSMPFYAEYLWGRVKTKDDVESVHLADWPKGGDIDESVITQMQTTRDIVSQALELRAKANIKVRQPLQTLLIKESLEDEAYMGLIRDEVNIKEVKHQKNIPESVALDTEITPELQKEGDMRELVRQIQDLRKQAGLEAKDRVIVLMQTSDGGEDLVKLFMEEIQKIIGADSITFGDAQGTEVHAGEHSFTVEINKV